MWCVVNGNKSGWFYRLSRLHTPIYICSHFILSPSFGQEAQQNRFFFTLSFIYSWILISFKFVEDTEQFFLLLEFWAHRVSALEYMQAKFTDAGESKHEVFALTYYVSDSDDNEKERFFPVKRLQIYLANHGHLFGSRFNRGKFIFLITVASLLFQTGQSIKTRWQEFNKVNGNATSYFPCQQ